MRTALWIDRFAARDGDSAAQRFEKKLIVVVALSCCVCGLVWSALYTWTFGVGLTMALPLAFVVIVGAAIAVAARLRDHRPLIAAQLACITWISALIGWSIGSVHASGLVLCWSFLGPVGALIFLPLRAAMWWMAQFLVIVVVSAVFRPTLLGRVLDVDDGTVALFYVMNIGASLAVVFAAAAWFMHQLRAERARSEALVANMLPAAVAEQLKGGAGTIAEAHASVSVLFADIVGFTTYSASVRPEELVADLNLVFSRFDALAAERGIEKIKTIGDAYMAASGVPTARGDHAEMLVRFALELRDAASAITRRDGAPLRLRIGVHSGPAVAGVIGTARFAYDLWGDTVNTASRMESHGEPGEIQVSAVTAALLGPAFALQSRGVVDVKGKGAMELFWVRGVAA